MEPGILQETSDVNLEVRISPQYKAFSIHQEILGSFRRPQNSSPPYPHCFCEFCTELEVS